MGGAFTLAEATGTPANVGRIHAQATMRLVDDVAAWIEHVSARHPLRDPTVRGHLGDVERTLEKHAPGTLEQLSAMGAEYQLPPEGLLLANLGSYLDCLLGVPGHATVEDLDGCSTVAWSGGDGGPVLAKNRDNNRRFLHMQTVLRVTPDGGLRWLALSTAGAPDAHSSGVNERGLIVADTHVPSKDVGPGLPRFTIMAQVLERCADLDSALDLVQGVPHLGLGNLILADENGQIAVVESGHRTVCVRRRSHGYLSATNHFTDDEHIIAAGEPGTSGRGADSRRRLESVEAAAASARGHDLEGAAERLLLDPVVCQRRPDAEWLTTSTAIYSARKRTMRLRVGDPAVSTECVTIPVIP